MVGLNFTKSRPFLIFGWTVENKLSGGVHSALLWDLEILTTAYFLFPDRTRTKYSTPQN